jgi:hypothetical protein
VRSIDEIIIKTVARIVLDYLFAQTADEIVLGVTIIVFVAVR